MMEEFVPGGEIDGGTPKNTSLGRFLSVFVSVVAVYAIAATLASSGSNGDFGGNTHADGAMRGDSLPTETLRGAMRRDLQLDDNPGGNRTLRYLQGDVVVGPNGTRRFLQVPGNGTRYLQVDNNGTRYLQEVGGNRTRYLQVDTNGTRYLQDANGTRFLQDANGTRFLQDSNGTRYLQVVEEPDTNGTRRMLEDIDLSMELLYPETIDLKLPSPCHRVDVGMPNSPEWRARCQMYLNEAYSLKDCEGKPEKVPRIYHSVSHHSDQTYHQLATSAQNPSFLRNHLSDDEAADFIKNNCGEEAHDAYRCFAPPAYRADLFRFCALYSQGGIYLDEDIFPFVPLHELYSPCATATVGHDFPWMDKKGKQMKILASSPGAPIFQCALRTIIENVRARAYPESELELTGPQMLQKCYEEHQEDVAVTYHDTRNAEWPFTGMRRGQKILAYEIPMSSKHFWQEGGKDKEDYKDLFNKRLVYTETCELQ